MELDITKHGDILEVSYSSLIIEKLPAYAEIWKRFIGNTGKGRMIEVEGLDPKEKYRRILFSQYNYSCFESIVAMQQLVKKLSLAKVSDIDSYVQINNDFLAFQAHAGRIRDGVKKMGEYFHINDLYKGLNEYYQQRNEILHGCKVPYMIIEGMLAIPLIKGEEDIVDRWNSKCDWHEMNGKDFEFLADFVSATFDGIAEKLNSTLYRLLPKIKETTNQLKIALDLNEHQYFEYSPSASGIIDNHIFNAVAFQNKFGSLE